MKVVVDRGALQMVLNILRRNAERLGQPTMAEAADELQKSAVQLMQQSVSVAGEPVAWLIFFEDTEVKPELFMGEGAEAAARYRHKELLLRWNCHLMMTAPTTSITAAELDALRKDAERYRWLRYNASYSIHEMLFGKPAFITTHKESDLDEAIDAAIAAEGE